VRLVQHVRARLEVVFETAESARRPAHVITELPLGLFGRLRSRLVGAADDAVREDQHGLRGASGNRVLEGRDLEEHLVQLRAATGVERRDQGDIQLQEQIDGDEHAQLVRIRLLSDYRKATVEIKVQFQNIDPGLA